MTQTIPRRAFALGTLTLLTGCGFQPVYMPTASGKAGVAQRELASIYVGAIPDRPGQIMRQALQERLGSDSGTPAKYDLTVAFGVAGEGIGIEQDSIATYIRLSGNATWILRSREPGAPVLTTGSARAYDGVNMFDTQYFAADQEVESKQAKMAEAIATQIATQLAVWFRQRAAHEAS